MTRPAVQPRGLEVIAGRSDEEVDMGMHQLVAILIFILAIVAVLPIPNLPYRWPLAVAIMLLAVLQFLEGRPAFLQ